VHFTWDISLGQVAISIPILWGVIMLLKIHQMMLRFRIEHEMLMRDWGGRQTPPVKLEDLPTRQTKWW
jgi:hypothetical protein